MQEIIGRLLEAYMDENGIIYEAGGAETFKKKKAEKGFEPDECYWISSHAEMLNVDRWDPQKRPPPDLAVEIELTSSLVPRLPAYSAIGVREVWWYHDDRLEILLLQADGRYVPSAVSPALPTLAAGLVLDHVKLAGRITTSQIVAKFMRALKPRRRRSHPQPRTHD